MPLCERSPFIVAITNETSSENIDLNGKILSGVVIAVLAIALIGTYFYTQSVHSGTTSVVNSTNTQSSNGQSGTLALLMTDPPTIPAGVSAVYINYSDVQVHISNAGNQTGWTDMQSSGDINLLSIVNSSQTIATANITAGVFNALKFNISSAVITFQSQNYTTNLVYQQHSLFVTIPGGITITNGLTSGAIIEMAPTVLLLGNTTNPTFAFMPEAQGYTLAANSIAIHPRTGDRDDYRGSISDHDSDTHFQMTALAVSPSTIAITVQNTGSENIRFKFAALTSTTTVSGGWVPSSSFGSISKISEFFVVVQNGSLVPLTAATYKGIVQTLALAGYNLAPNQSVTFTYSGVVTIGALAQLQGKTPTQPINIGQRYVMTIVGSGTFARSLVNATSSTTTSMSTSNTSTTASSSTSSSSATSSTITTTSSTTITTTSSTTITTTSPA